MDKGSYCLADKFVFDILQLEHSVFFCPWQGFRFLCDMYLYLYDHVLSIIASQHCAGAPHGKLHKNSLTVSEYMIFFSKFSGILPV